MLPKQLAVKGCMAGKVKDIPASMCHDESLAITMGHLFGATAEDVVSYCNGDVEKIFKYLGAYGLSKYSGLSIEKVLSEFARNSNYKVQESGYIDNRPLIESTYEYMLNNQHGELADFRARFGQVGMLAYSHFQRLGFIKSLVDHTEKGESYSTYKFNNNGVKSALLYEVGRSTDKLHELLKDCQ